MAKMARVFGTMLGRASLLLRDKARLLRLLRLAAGMARRHERPLEAVRANLSALMRMVRAWAAGEYTDAPWRSLTFAVAALLYFVSPLDAIADIIPALGLVDDVLVITWVVNSISEDLDHFLEWERQEPGAA